MRVARIVNLRFVSLVFVVMQTNSLLYMVLAKPFRAPKSHHHQASHLNRSQKRFHCANEPEDFAETSRKTELSGHPSLPENLILREEARKNRDPANRQPARAHREPGDRHILSQSTPSAHVLLVMQPRDYRTLTEEK